MMNSELKPLLKGKWEYNLQGPKLICRNRTGLTYVFENKNDLYFQTLLDSLKNSRAKPDLKIEYEKPTVPIPLEVFHRILRANEVIYEPLVGIKQETSGLYCFSEFTKDFRINHYEYDHSKTVYIDPQRLCKITRRIRDRERVHTKLLLEDKRIIMECEFPWIVLTIILPTVMGVYLQ